MTQSTFPMPDVAYDQTNWTQYFGALYRSGVFMPIGEALKIKASTNGGMRVRVSDGMALANGYLYVNDTESDLQIPIASTLQDRVDSVAIKLNLNEYTFQLVYKQSDVSVNREGNVYEIQLAQITVPMNANTITAANIKDTRGIDGLGGYASPFEKVSVSGLEEQYTVLLQQVLADAKAASANNTADQQAQLQAMYSTFQTWLAQLQSDLSGDDATALWAAFGKINPSHDAGIELEHNFIGVPQVVAFAWDYALGSVPIGTEPEGAFGGTNRRTIPVKVEFPDFGKLKVYLDDDNQMINPTITQHADNEYTLQEGHRTIGLLLTGEVYHD
ncbi:hypothetical protein [Weissella cibaria]|uniref:hypothetical protein n=1 Tax=Weissella cibaria TaxID=137591 RepID=UPI00215A9BDB|nr:hypothetical protein [Weissella cibaria]MCR8704189.1 hypothetical protein [Weissella cibaria]